MLSSQYQPLSGSAPRVRSERVSTPQLHESPLRSPEEDPSRWATHEGMAGSWGSRVLEGGLASVCVYESDS